jgi:RHS repeat-associated protein
VLRNTPASTSTNRLTGAVAYDSSGNLTSWNGQSYVYDVFNMMKWTDTGSEAWGYVYTADDERVLQLSGDGEREIWTIRDLGNRVLRRDERVGTEVTVTDYIWRGNQLLAAAEDDGSVEHFALDHLGTPRVITDGTGQVVAQHAYFPFGEEATDPAQDGQVMKFTGHERDPKSTAGNTGDDLDYMHARFNSPLTGRFMAVDPAQESADQQQPQSWNRYTYSLGNPLKYVDQDGKNPVLVIAAAAAAYAFFSEPDAANAPESGETELIESAGPGGAIAAASEGAMLGGALRSGLELLGGGRTLVQGVLTRGTFGFTSGSNLAKHFAEHGVQMGFKSAAEYGSAALRFAGTASKDGVQAIVAKSGEKMIYNAATKEFAVIAKNGKIVTYFRARARYWAGKLRKASQNGSLIAIR